MSKLIESLHQFVTPQVLQSLSGHSGSDTHKKGALELIYRLFGARLSDGGLASRLGALNWNDASAVDGKKLFALLATDSPEAVSYQALDGENSTLVTSIYEALASKFDLPKDTVSALSTKALPLAYSHIKSLAGPKPVDVYASEEKDSLLGGLPVWLTALLPAGLLGASAAPYIPTNPLVESPIAQPSSAEPVLSAPAVTPAVHTDTPSSATVKETSFMKTLLPIIGALILAGLAWAMLRGCQKEPTPVAAPPEKPVVDTPAQALAPASLSLGLNGAGDALFNCKGVVGNAGLGEQLKAALSGVFSVADCAFDVNANTANEMPISQYLPQVLGFMKGVPDATLTLSDKTLRFNAGDEKALEKLIKDVQVALPDGFVVEREPSLNVEEAVKSSINAAETALESLTTSSSAEDLVRALNLQIINFASNSSEIPVENQAILDKAVEHLNALPNAKLLITGHTDSQGQEALNQKLSESRAKAVHDYLVAKGVSDDKLEIKGASSSSPVATNATEQGRFANRRIEFTVFEAGETVVPTTAPNQDATALKEDTKKAADAAKEAAKTVAADIKDVAANVVDATKEVAGNKSESANK